MGHFKEGHKHNPDSKYYKYRRNGLVNGRTCACSRVAYRLKDGSWICTRCDTIEKEAAGHFHADREFKTKTLSYDIFDYGILRIAI